MAATFIVHWDLQPNLATFWILIKSQETCSQIENGKYLQPQQAFLIC